MSFIQKMKKIVFMLFQNEDEYDSDVELHRPKRKMRQKIIIFGYVKAPKRVVSTQNHLAFNIACEFAHENVADWLVQLRLI